MLTVKVVLFPAVKVCELGEVEMEKSGGGLFVLKIMLTVALWLRVPLVPAMVRVYVPAAVLLLVEMFSVEMPAVVIDAGL